MFLYQIVINSDEFLREKGKREKGNTSGKKAQREIDQKKTKMQIYSYCENL